MALAYVTVTGTWDDGSGQPVTGTVTFTPSETAYSAGQQVVTPSRPVSCPITDGRLVTASGGPVQLLATDNTGLTLMGRTGFWFWTVAVNIGGGSAGQTDSFSFFLPYTSSPVDLYGLANQVLSDFPNPLTALGDLMAGGAGGSPQRLAGNTTSAREFLVSQGTGSAAQAPAWGALQAGDIPALPYLAPNGSGAALTGITPAQAGADASGAAAAVLASSAQKSANLSDLASAGTARTNLGLGSAATQASSAFDAAGAAAAAQAASLPATDDLSAIATANATAASVPMNGHKFTGLVNGSASGDSATYGQVQAAIAASLPTLAQASASASATLAVNTVTTVTAATALTMTLPASVTNALIVVERESASVANVAVTGNIRGVAAQTVTLSLSSESEMFLGYGGSWWPVAGHKTLGSLQALFAQLANNLSDMPAPAAGLANLAGAPAAADWQAGDAAGRSSYVPTFSHPPSAFMTIGNQPLNSMQWPCPLYVGDIFGGPGPYGELWRVYYSTDHVSSVNSGSLQSGTGLLTCPSATPETGTWTARGLVFTDTTGGTTYQTETPTVVYVPDAPGGAAFYMYYHVLGASGVAASEVVKLATMTVTQALSSESWTISTVNSGIVLDTPLSPGSYGNYTAPFYGYFRPFRVGQDWIAYTLVAGNPYGYAGIARSRTGLPGSWTLDARPLIYNANVLADPQGRFNQSSHYISWNNASVFRWKGQKWWLGLIFAHVGGGGAPTYSFFGLAPLSEDYRRLLATPQVIWNSAQSWEQGVSGGPPGMINSHSAGFTVIGPDGKLRYFYQGASQQDLNTGSQAAHGAFGIAVAS